MKQQKFWDVPITRERKRLTPKASHYCRICGRPLTDAVSIQRGVGKDCWERIRESKNNSKNLFDIGGELNEIEKIHE